MLQERGPDGLLAFWFERGLGVDTASSLAISIDRTNDVISEPPGQGKGGGGFADTRLREDFRNTAFWEAQLVTDADGRASVDVPMPDNLTTWRLQARAISGDTQVGEATHELVSTLPVLLRPALPRFLRVGDSAVIRALAQNNTDEPMEIAVSLDAEGIEADDNTSQSATVPAGEAHVFEWPATVQAEGTAELTFSLTAEGGFTDAVRHEIPGPPRRRARDDGDGRGCHGRAPARSRLPAARSPSSRAAP